MSFGDASPRRRGGDILIGTPRTSRETALAKRRAVIVRRQRRMDEARAVAAKITTTDKSAGLEGVARELAQKGTRR